MKKISKISLHQLDRAELSKKQQGLLFGGGDPGWCKCGSCATPSGGSPSTAENEEIHSLFDYPVLRPSKVCGPLIISIGNNGIRRKIAKELKVEYGKAFHPSAIISEETEIREGSVVMQGAIVQSDACIDRKSVV